MTTETSDARGEWVLVPRVPTDEMLEAAMGKYKSGGLWNVYAAMLAAAPPPAAARGDVRGLVGDLHEIARLIGAIFFAGDFKAETLNERELEALLVNRGYRYTSWDEVHAAALAAEGVQAAVPYDRELIARMLERCEHTDYSRAALVEQARLLRAADNASASAETVSRKPADAEGVQAGEVDQRLLANLEAAWFTVCDALDEVDPDWMMGDKVGAEAAAAKIRALSQQPEARGVVASDASDDGFVSRYSLLLHDLRMFVDGLREVGLKDDADALGEIVSEAPPLTALTEARNVR